MQISSGGHFEIQYGGHKGRISSGPISENVCNILVYICAKFGDCITKFTIHVNVWAKPPHYNNRIAAHVQCTQQLVTNTEVHSSKCSYGKTWHGIGNLESTRNVTVTQVLSTLIELRF